MKLKLLMLFCIYAGIAANGQTLVFDPSFGEGGIALPSIGPDTDVISDTELQADGKILAVGYGWAVGSNNSDGFSTLVRFLPDGSLDPDFGTDGIVTEQINDWSRASSVKLQSDGKIIVAGSTKAATSKSITYLIRYTSIGERDVTFGDNGLILFNNAEGPNIQNNSFRDLVIQPDDKIITGGLSMIYSEELGWHYDYALYRFNSDGTPDAGFGIAGRVLANFDYVSGDPFIEATEVIEKIALQPDGSIVTATRALGSYVFSRLDTNGAFDASFGDAGHTTLAIKLFTTASLLIQPDGKIILSASAYPPDSTPQNQGQDKLEHMLICLTGDGSLDPDFGSGGKITSVFSGFAFKGGAAVLLPDGKILAAGAKFAPLTTTKAMVLIRYNSNGTYDQTLGTDGRLVFNFGESEGYNVYDMLLQGDGKTLISGSTGVNPDLGTIQEFFVMRLQEQEIVGLNDNTFTAITLYPNPVSATLTLANAESMKIENITVSDLTGKVVLMQNSNASQIDVQQLPAGMYLLNVSAGGSVQYLKFIKQ